MQRILLTLLLSVSFTLSSFAQRNYPQELISLIEQGRCFEAREYRSQYADKLPSNDRTFDVFYKAHMALFFNKPDSAAIYLEDLIANHELKIGPRIGTYYGKLLTVYDSKQRFNEGILLCDKYMDHLKRNPFDRDLRFIQNELTTIENIKKEFGYYEIEPRIKIERDSAAREAIKINDGEYIRFNAKYNNVTAETWFDTGVPGFMITRSLADNIGTKLINKSKDSVQIINGIPVRARIEVIDQITMGSVTLYNIPVLVFNERFVPYTADSLNVNANIEKKINDRQIVMGVSAMKLIGRIDFDLEKRTVSFPGSTEKIGSSDSSNIYFADRDLYMKLKINELNYVGYLNTGSDCTLNMTSSFHEKYKRQAETDSIAQRKPLVHHTTAGNIFPDVNLDVKLITNENEVLISDRKHRVNIFDGVIGVNLFKKLGSKIIFDFNNMRVKVSR
ncbi:aspartyl protease [Arcticibacter tournemirensis]|uniref:Aspartyl protease n=1 Tax=Arcticibacter tournemirensis TaxID=699437 RepID=A0A5M9HJ90_9SPHI|nr:retropepsin-like aspartic protease [Arcticibacter tournemirensis]KAA8485067.1 hypothetical protein F1649_05395 [Arcticibacter tournemirensis]TQM50473.1 aspartyl protease [Arcticibacter tournemirensis]